MNARKGHKLRLPVRVVDGVIELDYGGLLPIRHDAVAELIVEADHIEDQTFLERLSQHRTVKLLPEGTELLVIMSANSPAAIPNGVVARPKLGKWFDPGRFPAYPSFVRAVIGPLLPWQDAPDGGKDGGLWLEMIGTRGIKLISSSIEVPALRRAGWITSLNHACTLLSEEFEPHRISHSVNVYEKVLYRENNGLWYPLKLFRNGAIADEENAIAQAFWADLKARFAPPPKPE